MQKVVGISGMGRIGRLVLRRAFLCGFGGKIGAINCTHSPETVAHLLKYDSVHGIWDADITAADGKIVINGQPVTLLAEREPEKLPWGRTGVGLVIDATGQFADRAGASRHLTAGADKVLVTSPGSGLDATLIPGVNDGLYDAARHRLVSAASCTTQCVAPVLSVLDREFGIQGAWITTIHAFTSDQNHLDNPHKDLRRARGCTQSIVPTTTGIGKALAGVLPHLAPVVRGLSVRVPVPDVSLADMTLTLKKAAQKEAVLGALRAAAGKPDGVRIAVSRDPLVSADYVGCECSAVVDEPSVAASGSEIKLLAWYDNEWAYACRVVELADRMSSSLHSQGALAGTKAGR